jgi:hypothetical protein
MISADAVIAAKPFAEPGKKRLLAYCAAVASAPFLLLVAGLLIAPTDWTVRRSGNIFLANLGYVTKLKNADCQVVIAGDSTAMLDLDPAIIRERTGLSACNIGEPANVLMVNGVTLIPDLYLQNNPKPRLWVFTFLADGLAPFQTWTRWPFFEGLVFRLRLRQDLSTLKLLAEHPKETIDFAGNGLRFALLGILHHPLSTADTEIRSLHDGHLPSPSPPLTTCPKERIEYPSDAALISGLRARYGVDGTGVIVDVSPKPTCDPSLDYYAVQHPAPTDNKLEAYPVSDFDNSGRSHMTRPGVARFSNEVSDQILETLKRRTASYSEGSASVEAQ